MFVPIAADFRRGILETSAKEEEDIDGDEAPDNTRKSRNVMTVKEDDTSQEGVQN